MLHEALFGVVSVCGTLVVLAIIVLVLGAITWLALRER